MAYRAIPNLALPGMLPPVPRHPALAEQGDIQYHETRSRSILNPPEVTGMDYWSINPYIGCAFGCAYCYARYAHRYVMQRVAESVGKPDVHYSDGAAAAVGTHGADAQMPSPDDDLAYAGRILPPWLAFERRIFVKRNAAAVLRHSLRHGSDRFLRLLRGDQIVIGTATDPYQPAERKYGITRGILEILAEHPGLNISIITKSPLVTRDVDILKRLCRHSRLHIHISLITPHRELARRLEPRSPTPESRLRAIRRLVDAGLDAGVFCMPVLPGITDSPHDLELLVKSVAASGATHFVAGSLRLRVTARQRYLPVISREFPHLAERYARTFALTHELPLSYRRGLSAFVSKLCRKYSISRQTGDRAATVPPELTSNSGDDDQLDLLFGDYLPG